MHAQLAPDRKSARWLGAGLALLLLAFGPPATALEYVAHAIDGDTIVMLDGEVVRLENVDAPEIRCQCVSECRRALAAFAITRDLSAAGIELERRTTRSGRGRPDRTAARLRGCGCQTVAI